MTQNFGIEKTEFNDVKIVNPFVATDLRGSFIKDYSSEQLNNLGIKHDLKEVFYTVSHKGVIRAIHFQRVYEQAKLVRVVKGSIFDVVVDLRPESGTFGSWQGFYLNDETLRSILIPEHFGHGYLVLEDSVVSYKCTEKFYGEYDDGIIWNDPDINIDWPLNKAGSNIILSDKDKKLQSFKEFKQKYY